MEQLESRAGVVDEVLATTRSVRRRLDLRRPVPDELILECIDLAEQAPTGGNQSSRRWLVVRDPARKEALAELYREAGGRWMIDAAAGLAGRGHPNERVMASAAHLARHLGEVPAIVIPTIWGVHDGSGKPGLFDSVIQATWSFCLALRARGLGSAWTTVHLSREAEVASLLDIPAGVTQIVLLPVAYTLGAEFRRAARRPAEQITYFDAWGQVRVGGVPGMTAEVEVEAPPERVRELLGSTPEPGDLRVELDPLHGGRTRLRGSRALQDMPDPGVPGERQDRRRAEVRAEITAALLRIKELAERS